MATRALPTWPSAAPNPVMLRIMRDRLSYGTTTTLSIPEVPTHTVELRLSGHQIARNCRVILDQKIPVLIGEHCVEDANLDEPRELPIPADAVYAVARREES